MQLRHAWPWILLLAGGCAGASVEPTTRKAPDPSPRLILYKDKLYVRNAPVGLTKDNLLYALSADPVPGTEDHPKVGILQGVGRTGDSLQVNWYTLVDDDVTAILSGDGLPIQLIGEDMELRILRHWGGYEPQPQTPFPGLTGPIVLDLNLGDREGVKAEDKYEVLGEPRSTGLKRTVDSFKPLARCTILPVGLGLTRSRCQIDRGLEDLQFQEQHWRQGGYVRAITPHPPQSPAR